MTSNIFKLIEFDTLTEDDLSKPHPIKKGAGCNLLHVAAYYDSFESAKIILAKYPEMAWEPDIREYTPWYYCNKGSRTEKLLTHTRWKNVQRVYNKWIRDGTGKKYIGRPHILQDIVPLTFLVLF